MTNQSQLRIAVDVGGTFTDTVVMDAANSVIASAKTPTTPANPTLGAKLGVEQALAQTEHTLSEVTGFVHGTTLATNALIERRGAAVACVTTEGFRDILEIAYERRYSQYDINISKPDLIVPRRHCFTVPERILADGSVHQALDESCIDGLVASLDAANIEAVAICLLHSYANPVHEQRLRDLLLARRPDLAVSLSCEVSPEAREFERLCTTVANAYIQPLMAGYLASFASSFASDGLQCPILMMTSGGGMTTIDTAARYPIRLVESGPAGGAILAGQVAQKLAEPEVLSFDMGGTTAKLCLIDAYRPQTSRKFEIARAERFIKGSGMPVRIPVIEMIEIGAGGGSIASVDRLGRIQVGPQSAGSEPGPAAFGKGGDQPTVTDADVALGLIDPGNFAEGRLQINEAASHAALSEQVGQPLQLSAVGAAEGVSQIVDESMASAGRMHAVEAGKDLSNRTMIAFGGNGPLHATRVARRCGVNRIVIPTEPGVGSAVGFLHAPVSFEIVKSQYATLDGLDVGALNTLFDSLIAEATEVVRAGSPQAELTCRRIAFMRYRGQGHEIETPLPDRPLETRDIDALRRAFEEEYSRQFSRAVPGMIIEILNWAVTVSTPPPDIDPPTGAVDTQGVEPVGRRSIRCEVRGETVDADVYQRQLLKSGAHLTGPALIVEPQTTTFVSSDFNAEVLGSGALLLTRHSGGLTQ
ncbi:MAG: hydantoinase/oxoprolinase family protein [Rhizobiaceae bacterium]|nr:hydantoinase/oxoprolinase family protein [Rhizobiaceae bacterium]